MRGDLRVVPGGAVRVQQPGVGHFPAPRTPGIHPAVDAAMAPAPRIGEHGVAILAEIGFDAAAIARFRADNIQLLAKYQFDPRGLLNPGKMATFFPKETTANPQ